MQTVDKGFVISCRLWPPTSISLYYSISQDTHDDSVSSSSSSFSTTTSTPLLIEYGINGVKSRTLITLNVSSSRFPPFLQKSFVENRAITMSVSVQYSVNNMMSSGSTLLWMTKVIRDRTTGEIKSVLIRLGG